MRRLGAPIALALFSLAGCASSTGSTDASNAPPDARAADGAPVGSDVAPRQDTVDPTPDASRATDAAAAPDVVPQADVASLPDAPDAPVASNGTCATALTVDASSNLVPVDKRAAMEPSNACRPSPLPAVYYRVSVPARHALIAQLHQVIRGSGREQYYPRGYLRAIERCDATDGSCLGLDGERHRLLIENTAAEPREYVLIANDGWTVTSDELALGLRTAPLAPAAHALCEGAREVSDGTVLRDEETFRAPISEHICSGTVRSRGLFYRAAVPAGATLDFQAELHPTSVADRGAIYVAASLGCRPSECLVDDRMSPMRDGRLLWTNRTGTTQSVVIFGAAEAERGLRYDVRVSIGPR